MSGTMQIRVNEARKQKAVQYLLSFITAMLLLVLISSAAADGAPQTVILPDSITAIEEEAFMGDTALNRVILPEGTVSVGVKAFSGSSVKEIHLPRSLTDIATDAFEECPNLTAYVYADSDAHLFCLANGIPCVVKDEGYYENIYRTISPAIQDIERTYSNSGTQISIEDVPAVMEEVEQYLAYLYQEGALSEYTFNEYGATFVDTANHYLQGWTPNVEGLMSGDAETYVSIYTFHPNDGSLHKRFTDQARMVEDAIDYYSYEADYTNREVTLETIKAIGDNQIVLWMGHGGKLNRGDVVMPFMCTGLAWDDQYDESVGMNEIPACFKNGGYLCITNEFFNRNKRSMKNTLFWMGTCLGAATDLFFDVLTDNGATVVAYTDEVHESYHKNMLQSTLLWMLTRNPDTGKHYTISEALQKAKEEHGDSDMTFYNLWFHYAKAEVRGNLNYRLYYGKISGHVTESWGSHLPVAGAKMTIEGDGVIRELITDDEGYYEALLPPGEYNITLPQEHYKYQKSGSYMLSQFEEEKTVDLQLNGADVRVRLQDAVGNDIYGASVSIEMENRTILLLPETDEKGIFGYRSMVPLDEEKSYELTITADQFKTVQGPLKVTSNMDELRVLQLLGSLNGSVVDDETGEALEDAEVVCMKGDVSLTAYTGATGNFEFDNLDAGEYTVTISKDGYEQQVLGVTISLATHTVLLNPVRLVPSNELNAYYTYLKQLVASEGSSPMGTITTTMTLEDKNQVDPMHGQSGLLSAAVCDLDQDGHLELITVSIPEGAIPEGNLRLSLYIIKDQQVVRTSQTTFGYMGPLSDFPSCSMVVTLHRDENGVGHIACSRYNSGLSSSGSGKVWYWQKDQDNKLTDQYETTPADYTKLSDGAYHTLSSEGIRYADRFPDCLVCAMELSFKMTTYKYPYAAGTYTLQIIDATNLREMTGGTIDPAVYELHPLPASLTDW